MKRLALLIIILLLQQMLPIPATADGYVDHRGHNVDSLETVVARWTAPMIAQASAEQTRQLVRDWKELMLGYLQINGVKSMHYARCVLKTAEEKGWQLSIYEASKVIGQHFWAKDQYDSASFYYANAVRAIDKMAAGVPDMLAGEVYDEKAIDDAYSAMYGTLGNLYSMQDSIPTAMDYYNKALEIFKRHGWLNSCSVCCYNMAETVLNDGDTETAGRYYGESLDFARQANDSLWIASALKGFGNLYLATGKTRKALRCLDEADRYYSIHEDEELFARMETLDFTGQVLRMQKRSLAWALAGALAGLILALSLFYVSRLLRNARKEQKEAEAVFEETLDEMKPAPRPASDEATVKPSAESIAAPDIRLNDRELRILQLLSQGRTTPQIADEICLSPETVKWYRKKLLAKFDVSSSMELVIKAKESGIIS